MEYFTPHTGPAADPASGQLPSNTPPTSTNSSGTPWAGVIHNTEKTCRDPEKSGTGPAELPRAERALRFLPFSSGPRDCIGQNLAKLNYMTTLAVLLGRYKFRLAPEVSLEAQDGVPCV